MTNKKKTIGSLFQRAKKRLFARTTSIGSPPLPRYKQAMLASAILAALAMPASAAVNYVQPFNSAAGTDGWISRDSANANGFSSFANVTGGRSGNALQVTDGGFGWGAGKVIAGVAAGEEFTYSVWVNMSSTWNVSPSPYLYVRQLNASSALVGTVQKSTRISTFGSWVQVSMTGTIAATVTQVQIGLGDSRGSGSATFLIDDVSFVSVNPSSVARTWDGGGADDNFNTAANWAGDAAPNAGDSLIFDGSTRLSPSLNQNFSALGVTFAAGAGAFNITRPGAQVLTSTGDIINQSANLQTISTPVTISGAGKTINTGASGITLAGGTVAASGFTKTGAGTLTLQGGTNPNLAGTVAIGAGTLALGSAEQIANTAVVNVPTGSIFDLAGNNETIGRLGDGTSGGETRLGAGTLTITPDSSITGTTAFFGGDIKGDAGSKFVKDGAGEIRLHKSSMVNTFERLEVKNGIYRLGHGGAPNGTDAMLGAVPASFLQDQITISGGTLSFNGNAPASVISVNPNRGLTISGTATIEALVDTVIPGKITGTGLLAKTGGRDLRLEGANDFSGGLRLGGPVTIVDAGNVGTGTISWANNGSLNAAVPGLTITNAIDLSAPLVSTFGGNNDYTLSGDVDLGGTGSSPRLSVASATVTLSGTLTNKLGLIKDGAGTLVLSGANTYEGATIVSNGTLHVTGTGSTSTNTVTVAGGKLSGTGTISGDVTIANGGTLSAGASAGALTTANLVWNGGGTNVVEVNDATGTAGANWDVINVNGTLTINATLASKFNIDVVSLAGSTPGAAANFDGNTEYTWTIVTTTGGITGFNAGAFNIPAANFVGVTGNGQFRVAVQGNDLVLKYSTQNAPLFTSQPTATQTVTAGAQVILSASVSGTETLVYQWQKDGVNVVDGGDISGATTATLTLNNTVPANSGTYTLVVTNDYGTATSDNAVVTVIAPPTIVSQPVGATIPEGSNFNPTVVVSGGGTITYTWKRNGVDLVNGGNISGANTASLQITGVTIGQAGSYTVAISNEVGNVTSDPAVLVVEAAPIITAQPQDVAAIDGQVATFSVTATGHSLAYQWSRNGVQISGATDSSYSVTASAATIGYYHVVVTNSLGNAISDTAALSLDAKTLLFDNFDSYADQAAFEAAWPSVATASGTLVATNSKSAPKSIVIDATGTQRNGRSFAETGVAHGTNLVTFSYDFYDSDSNAGAYRQYANLQDTTAPSGTGQIISMGLNNNIASSHYMARILGIDGGTGASAYFKLDGAGAPTRSTGWHTLKAVISNTEVKFYVDGVLAKTVAYVGTARSYDNVRIGSALTSGAQTAGYDNVHVSVPAPALNITEQPANVVANAGTTAEFSVTAPSATVYQWRKNGVDIAGATEATLTLNSVLKADEGSYSVYINNGYSSTTSDAATLTVVDPAINTQPQSQNVALGANVSLSVVAAGTGTLTYQWSKDTVAISGATDATLNLPTVTHADSGSYTVTVTGDIGSVTSDPAIIDVQDVPTIVSQPVASQTVNQGAPATISVTAAGDAPLSYQWLKDDVQIPGATDATLTIPATALADAGTYKVTVANLVGSVTSDPSVLNVTPDTTAPVVKVLAPKANGVYSNSPSILLSGTAFDAVGISSVKYSLNGGAQADAAVTFVAVGKPHTYSATIEATPGTNVVIVVGADLAGNTHSVTNKFFFHTGSPYTLVQTLNGGDPGTNHVGTIVPNTIPLAMQAGASNLLYVGRTYTLKVKETGLPKYVLTNWTATWEGQSEPVIIQTNNVMCVFTMRSNMNIKANYIDNPFYRFGGAYNGLFSDPTNGVEFKSAGFAMLKVTDKQILSGKLFVDGNAIGFSGKLKIDGTGTIVTKSRVKVTDKPELTINVTLDFENGTETLSGTVTDGEWTSDLLAHRVTWSTNVGGTLATAYTNAYTFILPGFTNENEGPTGSSYQIVAVDRLGKVRGAGHSADGHVMRNASVLSKDGDWPYFSPQYKTSRLNALGKNTVETEGFLMGWLKFTTNSLGNMAPTGELHWINTGWTNATYAAGFTNAADVIGSRWVKPVPKSGVRAMQLTNTVLSFMDGGLTPFSATYLFTTNSTLAVIKPANPLDLPTYYPHAVKASAAATTGLIKGSFIHPLSPVGAKPTLWYGALLQDQNYGEGFFMGPVTGGKVTAVAEPPAP